MTVMDSTTSSPVRQSTRNATGIARRAFPSKIALVAAGELMLIAALLRWSDSPAFFAAAIACSLCAIQLGVVLMRRFQVDTRYIRRVARDAEFSSQSIFITDGDGRVKWANSRFTRLTGYQLAEISGKTFGMLLHGQQTSAKAVEVIRRQMRDCLPFDLDVMQYTRAGEPLWVTSKGEPVRDSRGQVTHYVITQSDISDQQKLIQELGKSAVVDVNASSQGNYADPNAETVMSMRVLELTRQLESLGSRDERDQLQGLIDGLKTGVEQCVAVLPQTAPVKVSGATSPNQHKYEG